MNEFWKLMNKIVDKFHIKFDSIDFVLFCIGVAIVIGMILNH